MRISSADWPLRISRSTPRSASSDWAISNSALISNDPGDATYDQLESKLANLNSQRDSIASQMIQILEDAEFNGKAIDPATASSLIQQANQFCNSFNRFVCPTLPIRRGRVGQTSLLGLRLCPNAGRNHRALLRTAKW